MADSSEDLREEFEQFEEFEQAESSMVSGLESPPERRGLPSWVKWMILADLVIIAAVLIIVLAA